MSKLSDIGKIIERQARFWEVRERIATEGGEAARRALAHLSEGPWVTISKQLGCAAGPVAARLAQDLHWQAFDKEILAAIADHTHSRAAVLSRLDEQAIGSINDYLAQMVVFNDPGQAAYLQQLVRVVWGLAKQGNAIIVGRGANFFLNPRFGLRVRLVAPLEFRIRRVAEVEEIDEISAKGLILKNDADQAAFIRQVFGRDIDDPTAFDLMLNMDMIGVETAALTIESALRSKLRPAR
jgi:cytidylate kinase